MCVVGEQYWPSDPVCSWLNAGTEGSLEYPSSGQALPLKLLEKKHDRNSTGMFAGTGRHTPGSVATSHCLLMELPRWQHGGMSYALTGCVRTDWGSCHALSD